MNAIIKTVLALTSIMLFSFAALAADRLEEDVQGKMAGDYQSVRKDATRRIASETDSSLNKSRAGNPGVSKANKSQARSARIHREKRTKR